MLLQSKSHKPPFKIVLLYQWKVEAGVNSFLGERPHLLYLPLPATASLYQCFAVFVVSLVTVSWLPFLFSQI